MRKSYGNTYWGKQFLNALKNIDYSSRLPRGKTYANKGTVSNIKIEDNIIIADVAGSRPRPYKVKFIFPAFTPKQKAQILEIVTDNPAFLSKLLNRELPASLNDACARNGIDIFPHSWDDLQGNCSCPDWAVPCKHMAATLFIIANEIDKNPFQVFGLHDFDLYQGLQGIGYTATGEQDVYIPELKEITEQYSYEEQKFTWSEEVFSRLDFSVLPDCREQLLTLLTDKPVFFPEGNFKSILDKAYKALQKNFLTKYKADPPEELPDGAQTTEHIEIILDDEADFLQCNLRDVRGKSVLRFTEADKLIAWTDDIPLNRLERVADAVRSLIVVNALAQKLCARAALIPQLLRVGVRHFKVRWIPAGMNAVVADLTEQVSHLVPSDILFHKSGQEIKQMRRDEHFTSLLSLFLTFYMNESYNRNAKVDNTAVGRMFFNGGMEHFGSFEQREYPKTIQLWLNKFYISDRRYVPVLRVEDYDGVFVVSVSVSDKENALEAPVPLREIFRKKQYNHLRLDILRSLSMLSEHFPGINDILAAKGDLKLEYDSQAFTEVLFKIMPVMQLFGIEVLLPKALRKLIRPSVSLQMDVTETGNTGGNSFLNLQEMLAFRWKIALGDQMVSAQEFKAMLKKYAGIVRINDAYVYFDKAEINKLLLQLENPPEPDHNELLQIALTENYQNARVELSNRLRDLMRNLLSGNPVPTPAGLQATLRPYQQNGYEWLYKNTRLGFGSIIADDMGLGKTLQVITTLLKLKEDGELKKRKALVIVPTTLLTNWGKEIAKFAPDLRAHIYHGPGRSLAPFEQADVLITTYGVARNDKELNKRKWLCTVIDEAQAIKNPGTAQTKAIKKIKSPVKIAMSGTPVENRLSEYWSIMDFANKGYLNSLKDFKENYAKPIEIDLDQQKLDRFKKITAPFILRRLKSDKSIIKDLPDKIEKDQYCTLTKEQAALYQNVVDTNLENIAKADGIARRGLVLKLITALKQVCNHPVHFLKSGTPEPQHSGKSMLLLDLLTDIEEANQKTLIFTQYQEMGRHLQSMIEAQFGFKPEFLHGGVSRSQRDAMTDNFQNNRNAKILILSLKAGGTGLNLTAANNVVHYDLWWNPAVEAQATDRAYRIGQQSNVLVHRFITQNTFEEKINAMLQQKKELAEMTVNTGEKRLDQMTDTELADFVKLG